jgi:hypothetical protein
MSTYQKFAPSLPKDNDVRSDVHTIALTRTSLNPKSLQLCVAADEYRHMRRAAPANVPLRRTMEWVESLPPRLRPHALMNRFARIANQLAAMWGDLECFEPYMESLLTDKRGNRNGFPPEVLAELADLERYRYTIRPSGSRWVDVGRRG